MPSSLAVSSVYVYGWLWGRLHATPPPCGVIAYIYAVQSFSISCSWAILKGAVLLTTYKSYSFSDFFQKPLEKRPKLLYLSNPMKLKYKSYSFSDFFQKPLEKRPKLLYLSNPMKLKKFIIHLARNIFVILQLFLSQRYQSYSASKSDGLKSSMQLGKGILETHYQIWQIFAYL